MTRDEAHAIAQELFPTATEIRLEDGAGSALSGTHRVWANHKIAKTARVRGHGDSWREALVNAARRLVDDPRSGAAAQAVLDKWGAEPIHEPLSYPMQLQPLGVNGAGERTGHEGVGADRFFR